MTLVILQQDYLSRRYNLDFLPQPLKVAAAPDLNSWNPDGALGLNKIDTPDILWQRFVDSPGWQVYGNGGVAHMSLGKGQVWAINARMMQRMQQPDVARALAKVLQIGGKQKPTVLIDTGTESGLYTTSCYPDLMNALDVPFLTLGEVIANEQGTNSFTPIPGPVMDDDVLAGQGAAMADAFLKGKVEQMSKRPTPPNLKDFEEERVRRKKEILKSLGLDPMPPKTPLNARITGIVQRPGYKIEKLVFESRPKFYVTAYVYKADNAPAGKLPVIVNVNGHWAHKKGEDRVQLRCAFQALQGYLVVAVDSPGFSFEGDNLIERRPEGDHNDWTLVEGGSNATGYYVWDTIRALDYMSTRPDADMNHVGLTGASGGGLATLYTFAADDRYKAAVPVVYMASLELAPDNGCLCNHVPGTCQVGDRSDVIAIQAPKPVYLMGAQQDGEFPPDATLLTHKKMAETWSLFGKSADTYVQIFAGGHDYNQPMREAMIGFFDKYLRGKGDGSPVPQPTIAPFDPEDHQFLVLDPPLAGERTMRDLSLEYLSQAPAKVSTQQAFAVNGGLPAVSDLKWKEIGDGSKRDVTFESEPGLVTPGVLYLPAGKVKGVRIYASDDGKPADIATNDPAAQTKDGFACLYLDALGTGELAGIEERYPIYLGRSVPFMGGWQLARAAQAMRKLSPHVEVVGAGPISSQAAMWAGLMDGKLAKVTGTGCLHEWADVFKSDLSPFAVQPRAHLLGTIESLRRRVSNGDWHE
jgi:dienelactone hydrolase